MPKALVYLVDDDSEIRTHLAECLADAGHKVLQFVSTEAFLDVLTDYSPAVIVSDMSLPGLSGVDLLKTVREAGFCMPLIFISGFSEPTQIIKGMKLGAVDFLWKPFKSEALVTAVNKALADDRLRVNNDNAHNSIKLLWDTMSDREKEVCQLMLLSYGNTEIALRLDIQPDTANKHRMKVLKKMHVNTRPELIALLKGFNLLEQQK